MGRTLLQNIKGADGEDGTDGADSTVPGPQGLPGTGAVPADAAVAGYATTPGTSQTKTALNEAFMPALGQFELQPMFVDGHSWFGSNANATPNARFFERVVKRLGMGAITNRGVSGRTSGDIANLILGGASSWALRTKALAILCCTINDVTLFDGSAAARRGYAHAWRTLLSVITANGVVAANTSTFVYSPGWVTEAVVGTSSSPQAATANSTSGTRWKTTTVGAYAEFSFTGTGVDVILTARAEGAGLATFTEGATARGSLDLSATVAQDVPAVHKIRGLSAGTHTIRATLASGASLTIDSYRVPSSAPAPVLVLGEPQVIPTSSDHPTYLADVETLKGDLAMLVAEYPSAKYLDLNQPGWSTSTMLVADGKHPQDHGSAWIASKVVDALSRMPYSTGLNVLAASYPAAYVAPVGPAVPSGGQDGTGGTVTPVPLPATVTAGFTSRHRAATLTTAEGSPVTNWPNEVSGGPTWTATAAPLMRTSEGVRRLEFDGVDDFMIRPSTPEQRGTRIVVVRMRDLTGGRNILAPSGGAAWTLGVASYLRWIINGGTALDSGVAASTDLVVVGGVFDGTTSMIAVNGGTPVTGPVGSGAPGTNTWMARTASTFTPVDVYEEIAWSTPLTSAELQASMAALRTAYGIA